MGQVTSLASNLILLGIILSFILAGVWKKINVYDAFIEGYKGFKAVRQSYNDAFLCGSDIVLLWTLFRKQTSARRLALVF